jgi:HD-GYP domain-containing protein (c-di-GMP phosphodiesterase class II)
MNEEAEALEFQQRINRLTEVGIALSAELNLAVLLEKALHHARELTQADAGTIYLLQDGRLHFRIVQNETLGVLLGGAGGGAIHLPPVELSPSNVSAQAALQGRTIRIDDVYESSEYDFSGPRRYDAQTGYRSKSMLVVPMRNHEREIIGVLQLINRVDPETKAVTPFPEFTVSLAESLASQAAVAITNASLIEETRNLFESLIRVLATAIDQKSPYTGNHVQRVAEFNLALARAINAKHDGKFADVHFSDKQLEEIRLSGWLHDVGKVVTPEWIMDKATKLETIFDRIVLVEARFGLIRRTFEIQTLRRELALLREGAAAEALEAADAELAERCRVLAEEYEFVARSNQPGEFMEPAKIERVRQIAAQTYELDGKTLPYLTGDEVHNLSVPRGTLTEEQMQIMRDHVVVTRRMLAEVPFKRHLSNVPLYASQHHEKLNGKGYPDGLKADQLSLQSRILAVADVYEALAAKDRPYKKPMPEEKVLGILAKMAEFGELDDDVLRLLTEDHVHRAFEEEYAKTAKTRAVEPEKNAGGK